MSLWSALPSILNLKAQGLTSKMVRLGRIVRKLSLLTPQKEKLGSTRQSLRRKKKDMLRTFSGCADAVSLVRAQRQGGRPNLKQAISLQTLSGWAFHAEIPVQSALVKVAIYACWSVASSCEEIKSKQA